MDPSLSQSAPTVEEHEWDSEDFVIPSLSIEDSDFINNNVPVVRDPKVPPQKQIIKEEEKIYLGPHGAPPSQTKQPELPTATGYKQKLKHRVKVADRKFRGTGRENKVETLRELVGSKVSNSYSTGTMSKGSPRDWLDPHCHESQFDKYSR
ncbi:hypothetical protein IHE45_08G001600 [Dioscorea alata]|uniref:Uncharacterized protein n=1 Tax=Dioscorea alata TaxID=55571 RepID=A0ACB7VGZ7_DIOAL|nr:hypothetical protein IHE45_08G001600 [Dioscorea alata]